MTKEPDVPDTPNGRLKAECKSKIWVNAEAFGYGPTAMAFTLLKQFRLLRCTDTGKAPALDFIATGLALELAKSPPWDAVHDCNLVEPGGPEQLAHLYRLHQPKLVISITDNVFAEAALALGARVVVIDPLFWFWKEMQTQWPKVDLLLVPNFPGVVENIKANNLVNVTVIPAFSPLPERKPGPRRGTLVNLGGLLNPMTPLQTSIDYARIVLRAVHNSVEQHDNDQDLPLTAFTSRQIRTALEDEFPDCFREATPETARQALSECRTAFLTSGIGNILDCIDLAETAAFFPPCSDSQGVQPGQLRKIGANPHVIDWHDIISGLSPIDYWRPYDETFAIIQKAQADVVASKGAQERLEEHCLSVLSSATGNVQGMETVPATLGRGDGLDYARAIANGGLGLHVSASPA